MWKAKLFHRHRPQPAPPPVPPTVPPPVPSPAIRLPSPLTLTLGGTPSPSCITNSTSPPPPIPSDSDIGWDTSCFNSNMSDFSIIGSTFTSSSTFTFTHVSRDVTVNTFHSNPKSSEVRYNTFKRSTNYNGQSTNNTRELGTGATFKTNGNSTLANGDSTYYEQSNNYSGQIYHYDYRVETYVGVQRSELKDVEMKMTHIETRSDAHENDISTLKNDVRSLLKKIEESPDELQGSPDTLQRSLDELQGSPDKLQRSPDELQRRINELEAKSALLLQCIRAKQGDPLAALWSTASPSAMSPPRSLLPQPPLPFRLPPPPGSYQPDPTPAKRRSNSVIANPGTLQLDPRPSKGLRQSGVTSVHDSGMRNATTPYVSMGRFPDCFMEQPLEMIQAYIAEVVQPIECPEVSRGKFDRAVVFISFTSPAEASAFATAWDLKYPGSQLAHHYWESNIVLQGKGF